MWISLARIRSWLAAFGAWLGAFSTWVTGHKEAIALLFALIGGVFAGWQYLASKADDRRRETIRYVDRSLNFEDPVGAAQIEMTKAILGDHRKCELRKAVEAYLDRTDPKALDRFISEKKLEAHILVLTRFYQSLHTCVRGNICDRATACEYFAGDIKELRDNYYGFFVDYRARWGRDLIDDPYTFASTCKKRIRSQAEADRKCPAAKAASAPNGSAPVPKADRG